MSSRLAQRLQFITERWVQRGVVNQLLLMAGLIVLVAVAGGVAARLWTSAFEDLPTAIWWSFLRLTDPGYLGDDEGTALRVVSTTVTVLGYVLFMGSLIAIMTQWLAGTVRKLESGLTPISMKGHFVILGWTNRTPEIIRKLLTAAGRLERFFARHGGASTLRVVVLADDVDVARRQELRDSLGSDWNEHKIFLRSGSSLRREHLERLDLVRAAVVLIPGADFELGGAELTDTRVVKTLLTLDNLFRGAPTTPHVVAELFDSRKVSIARSSIDARTDVISGDRLISCLLSQSLRHPGVATVLLRLMTHREGSSVYLRSFPELAGSSTRGLHTEFPDALVLGALSMEDGVPRVHMDPTEDVRLGEDDLLILVAEDYAHCRHVPQEQAERSWPEPRALNRAPATQRRRLLVLGWSYKIPALIAELLESNTSGFEVTVMSRVRVKERKRVLAHLDLGNGLQVEHVVGDYSLEADLRSVDPGSFDHVLFLASAWMESSSEADARTVLGVVLLRSLLQEGGGGQAEPDVLVELLDPENALILDRGSEAVFVSPRVLSHLLAHVALRHELHAVFEELTRAIGAEIDLIRAEALELGDREVTFAEVQDAAVAFGCIALGFSSLRRGAAPEMNLNPDRSRSWALQQNDRVIVLKNQEPA